MHQPVSNNRVLPAGAPATTSRPVSEMMTYPDEDLRVYPVSKKVNNPENDSPDLLGEVDIGELSGLSEFEG